MSAWRAARNLLRIETKMTGMPVSIADQELQQDDVRIICGDIRSVLVGVPSNSAQCVVTSPPYWGVRDYGVAGQIGAEPALRDSVNAAAIEWRALWRPT